MSERIESDALFNVLRRIGSFPNGCLLIGSCTLAVYRKMLDEPAKFILSKDADLLIDLGKRPNTSGFKERAQFLQLLRQRLVDSDWYSIVPSGPPTETSHVLVPKQPGGFTIEILAHMRDFSKSKRAAATDSLKISLKPQNVPNTSILLTHPWTHSLDDEVITIRVPNPLSFVLQKAEIRALRGEAKKDSDGAQILTIARLFANRRERTMELAATVKGAISARRWKSDVDTLLKSFGVVGSDLRGAIRALGGIEKPPSEKDASQWIQRFLAGCGVE